MDLTEPKGLFFDVYATLIDWEAGIYPPLLALAQQPDSPDLREQLLHAYHTHQIGIWRDSPTLLYPQVLEETYGRIAKERNVSFDQADAVTFGAGIGEWPAFPDTVDALRRLAKHYKLFVLSNVDNASFERTRTGPLQSAHWDGIYTAEDIGSYKPDPKNYHYVVDAAGEKFGIGKEQLVLVAQSLDIDHMSVKKLGFRPGIWISRSGSAMGGKREEMESKGEIELGAAFETLGDFANAADKAFAAKI
jgi:2-haloalkanoic acid dehalogenase type II